MILPDFKAFPKKGRMVGIDWGARRAGVAVSDDSREFVFVRPVVVFKEGQDSLARQLVDLAVAEKAVGIVMGLPIRMDGTESETTKAVRACASEMSIYTDLPICFIDETLSSYSAQEGMGRVNIRQIKEKLDSESAKVILENAIAVMNRL